MEIENPIQRAPAMQEFLDKLSTDLKGETIATAQKSDHCHNCKKPVTADSFKDHLSLKEYGISGLCQACQDKIFG